MNLIELEKNLIELEKIELKEEELEYKDWLNKEANNNATSIIRNSGRIKAALLMAKIFDIAQDYIYIYSKCLSEALTKTNIYYEALEKCVNKNINFKVLLQENTPISEARRLIESKSGNKVKILNFEEIESLNKTTLNMDAHFAIADDKIFRIEYDPKDYKAFASFNNKEIAIMLKERFLEFI